ncbi:DUF6230 family protein [Streptomyces massasporeus]|uniref:DUF6230 family protein n=1 Tax=Streptomyces massasporeus TaxID=67324 RepID=UPI0034004EDF
MVPLTRPLRVTVEVVVQRTRSCRGGRGLVHVRHRRSRSSVRRGAYSWSGFAGCMALGVTCAVSLAWAGTAAGVPVSFAVSGEAFKVSASRLHGEGFVQYASVDTDRKGGHRAVAVTAIRSASLRDLCQSVVTPTPLGPVTLRVRAGEERPVRIDDLVIDLEQMQGEITFDDLELGRDAADSRVPGAAGAPGAYSQQASGLVIRDLRQQTSSMTAGMFQLTGMHLSVSAGRHECF